MDGSDKQLSSEDLATAAQAARNRRTTDDTLTDQRDIDSAATRTAEGGNQDVSAATASTTNGPPDGNAQQRATATAEGTGADALIQPQVSDEYRRRWEAIQVQFVDKPRESVKEADGLVADVIQKLAQTFADERKKLEAQWSRGEDVSTEELRLGLQRYRSFFQRLLSA